MQDRSRSAPRDQYMIGRRAFVGGAISLPFGGADAVLARQREPVVATSSGKVRGRIEHGVEVYRGIRYAAPPREALRFLPPHPPASWAGTVDAQQYGHSAPQPALNAPERLPFAAIEPIDEDCLSLNVITPSSASEMKRPVMVWLHGGAWRVGAGSAPGLYGVQLAQLGEIVLVTINHRLDIMGFLKIDDSDERFADAGNLGVLDMIAALNWVRDNAEAFGGDPGNVTIFGQSGGGSKVAALLASPAAKGLFHKAIAESCSGCLKITGPDEAELLARTVAQKLGLPRLSGEALQRLPLDALLSASLARHRPAIDGRTFYRAPYDPDAAASAAGIPLMIGNVATETRIAMAAASLKNFRLSGAEVMRRLQRFLPLDSSSLASIMEAYRGQYPDATPSDLLGYVTSDYVYVRNTRRMADLHVAQAPVYTYMFMRETPVLDGLLRAPHESEVPFVFGTAAQARVMVGSSRDITALTHVMIKAWSRFAWFGRPENSLLPHWKPHVAGSDQAMLLNVHSREGDIPGSMARRSLQALPVFEYNMPLNFAKP